MESAPKKNCPMNLPRMCVGRFGLGAGGCCLLLGIALLIVPQVVLLNTVSSIESYLVKLMFIDNVNDTAKQGPQAGALSDQQQFQEFMADPRKAYQSCLEENPADSSTCKLGVGVSVAIFNVTNPEAAALKGEQPQLVELGPVRVRLLLANSDVDVSLWNHDGIARYRQNSTYVLDEKLCDASCRKLLASEVVVVNPIWAVLGWTGREKLVLFTGVATKLGAFGTQMLQVLLSTYFGLPSNDEVKAFQDTFTNTTLSKEWRLASMGAFLASAAKAQQTNGTCLMGSLALPAQKCAGVVAGFKFLLDTQWSTVLDSYSAHYGVGAAMPLFIRVTVSQVLGLNGSEIFDPLTGQSASYTLLADKLAVPYETQMASRFGAKGVAYAIGKDCSVDPACKLNISSDVGSCIASDVCSPRSLEGYGSKLPGRAFGKGFPQWTELGAQTNFTTGPVPVPYSAVSAHSRQVAVAGGQKQAMEYVHFEPNGWLRQLQNCGGDGVPSAAGRDCNGPASTLLVSRDKPLYLSAPFFNSSLFQQTTMNHGQVQVPFEPSSRVKMMPCVGSQWCEDKGRFEWFLNAEPETGMLFEARVVFQLNARIGMGKGMPPVFNVSEALVPIAWEVIEQSASSAQLALLLQAQTAPAGLLAIKAWFLAGAICWVVASLACCGCGVGVLLCHRRNAADAEDTSLTPKGGTQDTSSSHNV